MNITSPYWTPPPIFSTGTKGQRSFENNNGFFFQLPHPDIQTAGFYFGENPVDGRNELVFRSDPEYHAVDRTIPSSGGVPKYNIHDPIYSFQRSQFVRNF